MSGIILHGREIFGKPLAQWVKSRPMLNHQIRLGITIPPLSEVANVEPAVARIDSGRWIVDCPDCNGAEGVWIDTPLLWCCSCGNASLGGKWRPVELPDAATMGQVEQILGDLPAHDRYWWPMRQTIDQLREAIHGSHPPLPEDDLPAKPDPGIALYADGTEWAPDNEAWK